MSTDTLPLPYGPAMYPLGFVGVSGAFKVTDPWSEGAVAEIERFATLALCTLISGDACLDQHVPDGVLIRGRRLCMTGTQSQVWVKQVGIGAICATRGARAIDPKYI